jgi:AraC-like DNA-binding protein
MERIGRLLHELHGAIHREPGSCLVEAQRFLVELHERDRFRRAEHPDEEALRRAEEMLRRDPASRIKVAAVAATCGMGYEKFRKLFGRKNGISPHRYRLRCRMDEARRLLLDGRLSIKEIAYSLGYSEVANFAHQFRQVVGTTPGDYRQRR